MKKRDRAPDLFSYSTTSKAAAEAIADISATLRAAVFKELAICPGTADEVAKRLGIDKLAIRPRCSELRFDGKIRPSGIHRRNDSGRPAIVWEPNPGGEHERTV